MQKLIPTSGPKVHIHIYIYITYFGLFGSPGNGYSQSCFKLKYIPWSYLEPLAPGGPGFQKDGALWPSGAPDISLLELCM